MGRNHLILFLADDMKTAQARFAGESSEVAGFQRVVSVLNAGVGSVVSQLPFPCEGWSVFPFLQHLI